VALLPLVVLGPRWLIPCSQAGATSGSPIGLGASPRRVEALVPFALHLVIRLLRLLPQLRFVCCVSWVSACCWARPLTSS